MRPILFPLIYVHRKRLLWCPLLHAFCSLLGSVKTEGKTTESTRSSDFQVGIKVLPPFLWPVMRKEGSMESLSPAQPQLPRGSHWNQGTPGSTPKDIAFGTGARESKPEQGCTDPALRSRVFPARGHTQQKESLLGRQVT